LRVEEKGAKQKARSKNKVGKQKNLQKGQKISWTEKPPVTNIVPRKGPKTREVATRGGG